MKSETLIYGTKLLIMLNETEKISFKQLEEKFEIKGAELKELLKYLVKKEYISWDSRLFINEHHISDDKIRLANKGMEIYLGKRDYFSDLDNTTQTIQNQAIIQGNQNQVAQTTGDNSSIVQIQDNSKINILRKLIEYDKELEESKKIKLFDILERFNTLKESGENVFELIKEVGGIALKYVPLFFSLI